MNEVDMNDSDEDENALLSYFGKQDHDSEEAAADAAKVPALILSNTMFDHRTNQVEPGCAMFHTKQVGNLILLFEFM